MKNLVHIMGKIIRGTAKPNRCGRLLLILLTVILAGYLVACLVAPGHRIRQMNREGGAYPVQAGELKGTVPQFPDLASLVREKAFLESRIAMAGADSIGMSVNLRDSILALEINGIIIHRAKISHIRVDRFFYALDNQVYEGLFSGPLAVEREIATIDKEPVIVQKAPRDSVEALNSVFMPDTVRRRPAYVSFDLGGDIRLCLVEDGKGGLGRLFRELFFYTRIRSRQAWENMLAVLGMRVPPYTPEIRVSLAGEDIASIFRALYGRSLVAILI
jgi:hypothetical protein